jgi:glycosyltransferase involved in cell wall biosynthesis
MVMGNDQRACSRHCGARLMGSSKARISIGLCVFNGEQFLEQTIASYLAQTYGDFELLVSDNASTDRTGEIALDFSAKDQRVRYTRHAHNLGLAANYNRSFELTSGEMFKWATADDWCRPQYLEKCVQALDQDPDCVLAYPKTTFIDAHDTVLDIHDAGWNLQSESPAERLRYVILSGHWANSIVGLIRRRALARTRLLPAYPGGDYRVLAELSLLGKFCEVPEFLYVRRLHPGSSSQNTGNPRWLTEYWTGVDSRQSWPYWNRGIDHFHTIVHAQLRVMQKLALLRLLLRRMRWGRSQLLDELAAAVTKFLRLFWHSKGEKSL